MHFKSSKDIKSCFNANRKITQKEETIKASENNRLTQQATNDVQ
jgi:hypothetical protein